MCLLYVGRYGISCLKKEILSLEELDRLCNTFIELGVKKLRITGGEPLVRKNVMQLFGNLGKKIGHGLE